MDDAHKKMKRMDNAHKKMKRMDDARKKMKRINKNQGYKKGSARGKKTPWSQQDNKLLRDKFPLYFKKIVNVIHKHDLELIIPLLDGPRTVAQIRTKLNNMKLGKSK